MTTPQSPSDYLSTLKVRTSRHCFSRRGDPQLLPVQLLDPKVGIDRHCFTVWNGARRHHSVFWTILCSQFIQGLRV